MTCVDCGRIFDRNELVKWCEQKIDFHFERETLTLICPECWGKFKGKSPEQQFHEMIKKTGGVNYGGSEVSQDTRDKQDVRNL